MFGVIFGTDEVVPTLQEMSAEVSGWLADDLQANIVPWHAWDLVTVDGVFKGLVERVELNHALVRVVLAWRLDW